MEPSIWVQGLPSSYEIEHLVRVFFPAATPGPKPPRQGGRPLVYARAGRYRLAVGLRIGTQVQVRYAPKPAQPGEAKTRLAQLLYFLLKEITGVAPPWGMLTGVRPVRLLRNKRAAAGEVEAKKILVEGYDVSLPKYQLASEVARLQAPVLQSVRQKEFSLYVSIPFCPTRCSYCSFVSQSIEKEAGLLEPYLEKLLEEISLTGRLAKEMGLLLRSIYIGGGTPTTLGAKQLTQLLEGVSLAFKRGCCTEFTVEAGRPDCTSYEKLQVLKEHGVNRVSVNPQSMNEEVLQAIGRRHGANDILRCMEDACRAEISCINMDVIAGLPADTPEGFANSLSQLLMLQPENLTVHSLTLKRGSRLLEQGDAAGSTAGGMIEAAYPALQAGGYQPYYLYRQKNTPANLENTGWTKPGFAGYYNIMIMEEVQTIFSVGAGGVTKLVAEGGTRIKRLFNDKYPLEYVKNFEKVLLRKEEMREQYASFLDTEKACGNWAD